MHYRNINRAASVHIGYFQPHLQLNRGSYMSAHVLLNLLNELGEKIRCEALPTLITETSPYNSNPRVAPTCNI